MIRQSDGRDRKKERGNERRGREGGWGHSKPEPEFC